MEIFNVNTSRTNATEEVGVTGTHILSLIGNQAPQNTDKIPFSTSALSNEIKDGNKKVKNLVLTKVLLNVSNLQSISPEAGNDVLQCRFKVPEQIVFSLQPSSQTSVLTRPDLM